MVTGQWIFHFQTPSKGWKVYLCAAQYQGRRSGGGNREVPVEGEDERRRRHWVRSQTEESSMNTDITASVKPEYPVVDRNPPFTKAVANFSALDYLRLTTITGVSVTVGYLSGAFHPSLFLVFSRLLNTVIAGIKPNIRGPSMFTGGLIGLMGGFMYAYQNSAGRLMGFFPNDDEVARYKKK